MMRRLVSYDANLNRLTHRVIRRQGGVPCGRPSRVILDRHAGTLLAIHPVLTQLGRRTRRHIIPGVEVVYQSVCAVACMGRVTVPAARHRVVYVHRHVIWLLVNLRAQRATLRGSCGPC